MHFLLRLRKTKLLRIVLILLLVNIASIYFILNNNMSVISSLDNDNFNSINLPNTSDNEITIETPENKTYISPMSGYYPGTFGFENDDVNSNPVGFTVDELGGSVNVKDNIGGRDKVVEVYDTSSAYEPELRNSFPIQTSGTVEFWMMSDDVTYATYFRLMDDSATSLYTPGIGRVSLDENKIRYLDDIGWHDTSKVVYDNTWYHVKIEFECTSGNYRGLAQYNWRFYIDGEVFGDFGFEYNINNVSQAYFFTYWGDTNYRCYIDAIGYSWDSSYTIGSNLNEGLLLSYESSITLDWKGYSLDGQANKTILSNTTISMPGNGGHTIQVFGNDSIDTMYESAIQYFSVDNTTTPFINIITPENITYTEPMSGYYPATYGFEAYNSGEIPDSWNDLSGTGCSAGVVDEINNHKKVIQLNDNSGNGATIESFFPNQKTGIVEWWWLSTDVDNWVNFVFYEGGTNAIHLEIGISSFRYYDTSYKTVVSSGVNNNQWYRNKVEFSVSTDTFNWFIYDSNGNLLNSVQDANFRNSVADINHLTTGTNSEQLGFQTYIDAVGFSWDSNYNIGDNLNEGLLLSYDTNTNLNWTGYSLDGSPNITITGNKVIPFPEIGIHSIILNGITSNGVLIKSEIRYFTIFSIIQDPPIPPENPDLIPLLLTIIGIGIAVLIGVTILLIVRRRPTISRKKSSKGKKGSTGSDQFKVCPVCHTQINITDQFCQYCGSSTREA